MLKHLKLMTWSGEVQPTQENFVTIACSHPGPGDVLVPNLFVKASCLSPEFSYASRELSFSWWATPFLVKLSAGMPPIKEIALPGMDAK